MDKFKLLQEVLRIFQEERKLKLTATNLQDILDAVQDLDLDSTNMETEEDVANWIQENLNLEGKFDTNLFFVDRTNYAPEFFGKERNIGSVSLLEPNTGVIPLRVWYNGQIGGRAVIFDARVENKDGVKVNYVDPGSIAGSIVRMIDHAVNGDAEAELAGISRESVAGIVAGFIGASLGVSVDEWSPDISIHWDFNGNFSS